MFSDNMPGFEYDWRGECLKSEAEVKRLKQQLAAAREALVKIARRANPHEDDDDADRKRNLYHIESIANGAIKAIATLQRDRQP